MKCQNVEMIILISHQFILAIVPFSVSIGLVSIISSQNNAGLAVQNALRISSNGGNEGEPE